jgi:hypothetical protein
MDRGARKSAGVSRRDALTLPDPRIFRIGVTGQV